MAPNHPVCCAAKEAAAPFVVDVAASLALTMASEPILLELEMVDESAVVVAVAFVASEDVNIVVEGSRVVESKPAEELQPLEGIADDVSVADKEVAEYGIDSD